MLSANIARRIRFAISALLATAFASVAAGPAAASEGVTLSVCHLRAHVEFSNAVGATPTSGDLKTTRWGSMTCQGPVGSELPGLDGGATLDGGYGERSSEPVMGNFGDDSCAWGVSNVQLHGYLTSALQPVDAQHTTLDGNLLLQRTASAVQASGEGTMVELGRRNHWHATGVGAITPDSGEDCAITPMHSATLTLTLVLTR
jgi:hypothetical protein